MGHGGHWSPLVDGAGVLVGACCHLLLVLVHAHGSWPLFVDVGGGWPWFDGGCCR